MTYLMHFNYKRNKHLSSKILILVQVLNYFLIIDIFNQ